MGDKMGSRELLQYFWPEWHVIRPLGHGSFGDVFECEKTDSMRPGIRRTAASDEERVKSGGVAVKHSAVKVIQIPRSSDQIDQLREDGIAKEDAPAFFEQIAKDCVREIQTMESLKSAPNVVYIEDFRIAPKPDDVGWVILIRMELLQSLSDYQRIHPMYEKDVLRLGIDICRALVTCRKKSIIHRDIKPGNIMVNDDGDFKLADFGIARELDKSELNMSKKGTDTYMAPEMHTAAVYDARVDLYALGIVLFQQLNNNRVPFLDPFQQKITPTEKHNAVLRRTAGEAFPPPVYGSPATRAAIMRACAYRPEDRFFSAEEMMDALIAAYNSLPETADGPIPFSRGGMQQTGRSYSSANYGYGTSNGGSYGSGNNPPVGGSTPPFTNNTGFHTGGYQTGRSTRAAVGKEKKTGAAIIVLSVFIAALLIVLGVYLWSRFGKGDDNDSSDDSVSITQSADESESASTAPPAAPVISRATTETGDVLQNSNASSNRSFGADRALDGDPLTCWCVNTTAEGGAGAAIRFVLQEETAVTGFKIVNGNLYEPTDRLFQKNGQLCRFKLTFSNGETQTFTASQNTSGAPFFETFTFDKPITTGSILLTVESAYPGYKFKTNVCLGEFDVF